MLFRSHITLRVFDSLGRMVSSLVDEQQTAGYKQISFDGINLSSGLYFYVLESDFGLKTGKMILLK